MVYLIMKSNTKIKPTLIVDTREKQPWDLNFKDDFESICYQKLDTGDYTLLGFEDEICIERKQSVDELFVNFSGKNKKRIFAEIDRMCSIKYKFIIIEQTLDEILTPSCYYINASKKNTKSAWMPAMVVLKNLTKIAVDYGIQIIFAGNRGPYFARNLLMEIYDKYQ